jgi:lambda repressor-like predicted transcriptional regulator
VRSLAARRQVSLAEVAVLLRLDPRTVERVLARPRLRSDTADTLAVALGHHPCELWPEWFGDLPVAQREPSTSA